MNASSPRLKLLLWIALAFWAWMLVDLVTHPLAAGQNEGGNLFRWLSGLTGLFTVLTALFIMRRRARRSGGSPAIPVGSWRYGLVAAFRVGQYPAGNPCDTGFCTVFLLYILSGGYPSALSLSGRETLPARSRPLDTSSLQFCWR